MSHVYTTIEWVTATINAAVLTVSPALWSLYQALGNVNMASYHISNLADGIADQDASTVFQLSRWSAYHARSILDMFNHQIKDVSNATDDQDATTLLQVQNLIAAIPPPAPATQYAYFVEGGYLPCVTYYYAETNENVITLGSGNTLFTYLTLPNPIQTAVTNQWNVNQRNVIWKANIQSNGGQPYNQCFGWTCGVNYYINYGINLGQVALTVINPTNGSFTMNYNEGVFNISVTIPVTPT